MELNLAELWSKDEELKAMEDSIFLERIKSKMAEKLDRNEMVRKM
jgi:hypothetical protein